MSHPEVDSNHCYECKSPEVMFGSLYPLEPIYNAGMGMVNNPENPNAGNILPVRFNIDYNVCGKCYKKQHRRRYPDEPVPTKIDYLLKLKKLNSQWKEDQELENARALIARHDKEKN